MSVTFGGEVKTYRDMKTEIKNFPRGLDVKDLLYLIWRALCGDKSGISSGGAGSSGGCDCPGVMIIEGDVVNGYFVPNEGDISTAIAHIVSGGTVYLVSGDDYYLASVASSATGSERIVAGTASDYVTWDENVDPYNEGGGE